MNASISRAVVGGCLLLAIGTLLPGCKREPVPEYFGIYFQSSQGLREIPVQGDPAYIASGPKFRAAMAIAKTPEEKQAAMKALYDACQTATEQPVFILYHETIKPQMLHFRHVGKGGEVELGVTPIADKQFMYRLTPKQRLSKDVYLLVGSSEFVNNTLDCFLVGTRDQILQQGQQRRSNDARDKMRKYAVHLNSNGSNGSGSLSAGEILSIRRTLLVLWCVLSSFTFMASVSDGWENSLKHLIAQRLAVPLQTTDSSSILQKVMLRSSISGNTRC